MGEFGAICVTYVVIALLVSIGEMLDEVPGWIWVTIFLGGLVALNWFVFAISPQGVMLADMAVLFYYAVKA
jgi:hypothetical protein